MDSMQSNGAPSDDQTQSIFGSIAPEDFLDKDILDLMGAKDMSEDEKSEIYSKMMDTIEQRVLARMIEELTDEEYEELKTILAEKSEEKFADFAKKIDLNLTTMFAEEALMYKIEMVNLINMPKQNQKEE